MSTHVVPVIQIAEIEKHPNADALGLVKVFGYTCAVRLGEFQPGDLVAYIEPDMVVPGPDQHPAGHLFAFLGEHRRIKAKRLRGVYSQGLLVRAPTGTVVGDNVMELLGITRYEPFDTMAGGTEKPHQSLSNIPKYDIENWRGGSQASKRSWRDLFVPGERVIITEKIHGMNARYAWRDGRMWCGSRVQWKADESKSPWWMALRACPWIEAWCRAKPDAVLYGEVFGNVPKMRYGCREGQLSFRAFDVLFRDFGDGWMHADFLFGGDLGLTAEQLVPVVYGGPYPSDPAALEELARGDSRVPNANHMAEGIVIKPAMERTDYELGRVFAKLVSDRYLEKS